MNNKQEIAENSKGNNYLILPSKVDELLEITRLSNKFKNCESVIKIETIDADSIHSIGDPRYYE